ncbi:M15 family metallopeptidase [Paenibacillus albicereus]|uniref:M15 family metallopeptidase n=1 Tax=Paenibacillus albicereus TaxID=2726185 RepID=A0A6H2H2A2_9BACL|nr:M15 family metallopeptidase [Paenibacillus albicereus]QJC53729.1 M15 family metallopeptidase [Paenibacillus albicereus]
MNSNRMSAASALMLAAALTLSACSGGAAPGTEPSPSAPASVSPPASAGGDESLASPSPSQSPSPSVSPSPSSSPSAKPSDKPSEKPSEKPPASPAGAKGGSKFYEAIEVTANAAMATALVNKQFRLPEGYVPQDLVYPDIPFTFSDKIDKRKLRKEAAEALEQLVDGAAKDGIKLAGVSGYRSESRQKTLYESYVKKDGVQAADKYSARPGHSEHQTGLAIDVSGIDGKCAAESCFGGTPEAEWLAKYATDYGFIIRYPEGKEDITGYKYEPWHIRYVGADLAAKLAESGDTLEEHYGGAVPVSGSK